MSNLITLVRSGFARGLSYDAYLAAHAKPSELPNWQNFHARVALTGEQRSLLAGFVRTVNVLCLSGTWCGDCVQQCPFLDHIQRAAPSRIDVRFLERDANEELAEALSICGGKRVPVCVFMNEDLELASLFGDRTLSRYRTLASKQLGASCPLPGAPVPPDEIAAQLADFVAEFERVHLMFRLSTKLRTRHND